MSRPACQPPGIVETRAIAEEAYICGFPMIAACNAMYEFNVDQSSSQYKGPFNQIPNEARVYTYKDTAILTPNGRGDRGRFRQDRQGPHRYRKEHQRLADRVGAGRSCVLLIVDAGAAT
jgi:hypothetical protein